MTMAKTQHILFPVDFSAQVNAAIPYVAGFARELDATVTLLSVVPPIWAGRGPKPEYADELEVSTRKRLDGALTVEVHGLRVERVVVSGDPAEGILAYANDHQVDLIMMPTHGYGTFRRLLIGSVTAKVLHDAHCPVWTAAHAAEHTGEHMNEQGARRAAERYVPKKMLCCVDGGPQSVEQMRWAAAFSHEFGAQLRLLHVVPPVADWGVLVGDQQLEEEEREMARKRLRALCAEARVDAPLEIEVGRIAEVVAAQAAAENADLLIIGRGKIGATLGRLRTHAYEIIQRSACPVVSV
jgi:nucleotide-binding universal stress UspA family protein